MLDPKVRSHALRIHYLNTAQRAFAEWIHTQQDNLLNSFSEVSWHEVMKALSPDERAELHRLLANAVEPSDYARIETLIELLGSFRQLPSEDRGHLAVARGHLVDALIALRKGDSSSAWLAATLGREKLDWIIHGRKRGSDMRFRRIDETMMHQLGASLKAYDAIVERLGQVRANG